MPYFGLKSYWSLLLTLGPGFGLGFGLCAVYRFYTAQSLLPVSQASLSGDIPQVTKAREKILLSESLLPLSATTLRGERVPYNSGIKNNLISLTLISMKYVTGPYFRHTWNGMGSTCVGVRWCLLSGDPLSEDLGCGGLPLVVIQVVPSGGGADEKNKQFLYCSLFACGT